MEYLNAGGWLVNSALVDKNELKTMLPINDLNAIDPENIKQAKQSRYWSHWLTAIYEELATLKTKGVYKLVDDLLPTKHAIGSK